MLIFYFLLRIYFYFFIFCFLLTGIFSITNMLTKLVVTTVFSDIPVIFATLLPLMLLFSIPIASGMAVYAVVQGSIISQEFLFIQFFVKAKKAMINAIILFSMSLIPFYVPLIFQWAPSAYLSSKQIVLETAKHKLSVLQEKTLYTPLPGIAIFFEKKEKNIAKTIFSKLFFSFRERKKGHYLFAANSGFLLHNMLHLKEGNSLYINRRNEKYYASFNETVINLNNILNTETNKNLQSLPQPKFLTWSQFFNNKDKKVRIEWHKRIVQIIWLWAFPLLSFLAIITLFQKYQLTYITGIIISGLLFFLMYISLTLGQVNYDGLYTNIFIMYITILLVLLISMVMYKKRKL